MSSVMTTTPPDDSGSGSSGGTAGSPNTAMIILYSITGIITVLFLAIIITGALRAHRHPERYGPRYAAGRSRQSRARGIARAMLETIPIVKFGDDQAEGKPGTDKGDVEMDAGTESPPDEQNYNETARETVRETARETETADKPPEKSEGEATANEDKRASAAPSSSSPTANFACPICTDDFVKGQDLRVLPCNHKFHPECIDPWLVNVSGTCPLCRIDLNPPKEEQAQEGQTESENTTTETPQPEPEADRHTRHPRRFAGYLQNTLNARRMRDATVEERLAALRSVREQRNRDGAEHADDEQRRGNRMSTRLRERFRIGTRPHEGDPPQ